MQTDVFNPEHVFPSSHRGRDGEIELALVVVNPFVTPLFGLLIVTFVVDQTPAVGLVASGCVYRARSRVESTGVLNGDLGARCSYGKGR